MLREDKKKGILVSILDQDYTIEVMKVAEARKHMDTKYEVGTTDFYAKNIFLLDMQENAETIENKAKCVRNIEGVLNSNLRHELVHALFYESGLHVETSFATDETLIDWIAIMAPKMFRLFCQTKAFSLEEMNSFVHAYNSTNIKLEKEEDDG